MNLYEVTEEHFRELLLLLHVQHRQASKRVNAESSYLAGCDMIGAAVEMFVVAFCHCLYDEI